MEPNIARRGRWPGVGFFTPALRELSDLSLSPSKDRLFNDSGFRISLP